MKVVIISIAYDFFRLEFIIPGFVSEHDWHYYD